jgi:hypothetical protein
MGHPLDDVMTALLGLLVPAGEDANQVLTATATGLEGVRVFDGPPVNAPAELEYLVLGLSMDQDASVNGQDVQGWGGRRDVSYGITNLLQVMSGDTTVATVRRRLLQLLDAFGALLRADESLGGVCTRAWLSEWRYQAVESAKGATALIEFTVGVDAVRFEGE